MREEFIASIYQYIYIIVVAFLTLQYLPIYLRQTETAGHIGRPKSNDVIFLVFALIVFIGLRPVSYTYFNDMGAYSRNLSILANHEFEFDWETDNKIFDHLLLWFGSNQYDERIFFVLMATLYFGCMYLGIKRLFPDNVKLAFLTYLAGLSTFSYGVNGLKAGVAASIFILALSFRDKKFICVLFMLISWGFHHSMVLPIATFLIVFVIRRPRFYYLIWLLCLLISMLRITYFQQIFAELSDEKGAMYLTATEETTTAHIGFRPDFILYSAIPVIMGYIFEITGRYKLSRKYQFLIHFYILTNSIWMLCMYASFNNRIAYLSWFVYPIVIIAPFLDKQNKNPMRFLQLDKAVKYQLYFTMFMVFIYYGLFHLGN